MYCKRGLDCFLLKAKRTSAVRDLKKLNLSVLSGLETVCRMSSLSDSPICSTILSKCSNCRKPQVAITSSCLSQIRNVQTAGIYFPRRCKDTHEGHPVISSSDNYERLMPYEDLASRLVKCSSVEEQMQELCRIVCLTDEDLKRRKQLCTHIKELLSPFFKNYRVQMYGSSANGFGFKGCDIDMSLSIIGDNRKLVHSYFNDPDIPSTHDVISGKVSVEYIAKLPQKEQLLFIHSVLQEYYKESSEPALFINGYVPIVRFNHDKYNLKCDLSFGNSVAFRNTKLLKLCGLLDERVTPLMVTIRYWAKHIGLIGGGVSFNTYTISLLVLYFLQTRKPPVLPSVEHLLSLSGYLKNDDMEDDSYLQDIKRIPPSENMQTTVELLKEFFFFYAYFDYLQVICPRTATSVPRTKVYVQHRNFRMNTICIQDPIRPVHNVANFVDFTNCKTFSMELLMAVKLFHEGTLLFPSSSNWGILSLLEKPENYSATLSNDDHLLSFEIPSIPVSTENEGSEVASCPDKDTKQAWLQKMSQMVLGILEYALLFECKIEENSRHSQFDLNQYLIAEEKNQTLGDSCQHVFKASRSAVTSSIQLKDFQHLKKPSFAIKCVAYENTWLGREDLKMTDYLSNSLCNPLEMERAISMKLIDQRKKGGKEELFSFVCECYEVDYGKQTSLLIKLKPSQRTSFNPILGLFLKEYVPRTVNKILKSNDVRLPEQQNVLNSV